LIRAASSLEVPGLPAVVDLGLLHAPTLRTDSTP
jgi:hypothetical protein